MYRALCPPPQAPPRPRYAAVRTLYEPGPPARGSPVVLDAQALVLYLPAPRTVTGEEVLELHVHGGPATVKAVLVAIPRARARGRVRYAEPGEFTKRAFFRGRLDLGQVEALGDTLAAETEQQRRAAVGGSSGALGRTYEAWRRQLLLARGEMEALIDFSEDQHLDESPARLLGNVTRQVADMLQAIGRHERAGRRGELLRGGVRVALVGPPNVGKSSLMNLVVGREASIVSGEAGTTRDVVEARLDVRGYLCAFADTAGFRSAGAGADNGAVVGAVEAEGMRRARRRAQESDVVVALASVESGPRGPYVLHDAETLDLAARAEARLVVVNKRDTVDDETLAGLLAGFRAALGRRSAALAEAEPLAISCRPGHGGDARGVEDVVDGLAAACGRLTDLPADDQDLLGVTERQRQLLGRCRGHLEALLAEAGPDADDGAEPDVVLAAEDLRQAADCLARITGRGEAADVDEVLGVVFEK